MSLAPVEFDKHKVRQHMLYGTILVGKYRGSFIRLRISHLDGQGNQLYTLELFDQGWRVFMQLPAESLEGAADYTLEMFRRFIL